MSSGAICLAQVNQQDLDALGEVKIGVLNELSGPLASLGARCASGMEIARRTLAAENSVDGLPIKIIAGDVKDDAMTALSEYQRMAEVEKVQFIIPVRSKSALPVSPLAQRAGIVTYGIVGADNFLDNPLAIRIYAGAAKEGRLMAAVAQSLGKKRLAVVTREDEWALALSGAFSRAASDYGIEVVFNETLAAADTDFRTTITRLKVKKPDVIYVSMLAQSGLFVKKLREQGISAQLFSSYWIQAAEQMQIAGADSLEGLIFPEVDSNQPRFRALYTQINPGDAYNPAAYLCYTAMASALSAVRQAVKPLTRQSLREAALAMQSIELLDGSLVIQRREVQFPMVARTFRQGIVVSF